MSNEFPVVEREQMKEENPFEDEKIAQEWIRSVENGTHRFRDREFYLRLQEWIGRADAEIVVDIGMGQGICSEKLGDFNGRYIGIEPSKTLVDRAREIYATDHAEFVVGSAYDLPVETGIADAAFSIMVWFHLKDLDNASNEVARILKPDGRYLIITANPDAYDVWESFYANYEKDEQKIVGKIVITATTLSKNTLYLHSLSDIRDALERQGLDVGRVESFGSMNGKELFVLIEGKKRDDT